MAQKITQSPQGRDFKQALLLSLITATSWLWSFCISLYLLYHGGIDPAAGNSYGLPYVFLSGIILLIISRLVAAPVCGKLYGYYNKGGFISAGLLSVPIATIFSLPLDFLIVHKPGSTVLSCVFYIVSVFGLFPEGLYNTNALTALYYIFIFLIGFLGFYLSSKKNIKVLMLLVCVILCKVSIANAYDGRTHQEYLTTGAISLLDSKASAPYFVYIGDVCVHRGRC